MNALVKSSLKLIESIMKELNKALPTILIIVTMLVGVWNGCQSLEIKTEQKEAAIEVKKELAEAKAATDDQLDNIEIFARSASHSSIQTEEALEKVIEDMPPAKSADPEEQ